MATVGGLDIQISASAQNAEREINKLADSVERLAKSLNFDTSSLERLGKIKADFKKLGDDVQVFTNAASSLKNINFDNKNLTSFINAATRFSKIKIDDNGKFEAFGNSIKKTVDSLANAKDVSKTTTSVVSSMSRLASAGTKAGDEAKALPILKTNLSSLLNTLSRVPEAAKGTSELVSSVSRLASAGNRTKQTADHLNYLGQELKGFIQSLKDAPAVSASTVKLVSAAAQLASTGKSLNGIGSSMGKGFSGSIPSLNKFGNAIKQQTSHIKGMSKAIAGLKSSTGKAVANIKSFGTQILGAMGIYLGISGAINGIGKSITLSSDLAEVQNVIDVSFGKYKKSIEDFSKISISNYGMSELTAKEMAGRFQAMGVAVGFSQEKMADMSVELTKLAGDMASFYNVEQDAVAKSLQSVFTGETEPLRRYGLDLTNATVEEWAHKQGIDAKMQSMSNMEKVMLRYQYVLANTGAVEGDFLRTADTWANQVRVLKQSFEVLGTTVGGVLINVLKPFVKGLNTIMVYINDFAKTVSNALGKIFGWTYEEGGGMTNDFAGAADSAGDLSDGMDDVADATDKATKKQKEFNKQLAKFDELNNYTTSETGGKDKDSGGVSPGVGGIGGLDGGASGGKWMQGESIVKKFESEIDSLYKLGEYIGSALTEAMESIDWDSIYKKAEGFGSGLAEFLNGLFTGEKGKKLFEATGKTIAGALNTVIHGALGFATKFEWADFG